MGPETDPDFVGKNRPTEPFGFFIIYLSNSLNWSLRKKGRFYFFLTNCIFIIKKIMNTNRFKQLLESTMGNVKPLLVEETTRDPKNYNIDRLQIIDDETTFIYVKNPRLNSKTDPGRGFLTHNGQHVITNGECVTKDENGNPIKREWRSTDIQTIPDACRVRINNKTSDNKPPYFDTPVECTKNGCVSVDKFEF